MRKLGEIEIESLNLMFVSNQPINMATLSNNELDENFAPYLNKMIGSVNRCIGDIEDKRIVTRDEYLTSYTEINERYGKFDLPTDFFDIVSITMYLDEKIITDFQYNLKNGYIILPLIKDAAYHIDHYKKLQRIPTDASYDYEIDLDDDICDIIPYYVKGELYREDEPFEAGESMNWYEQRIEQLKENKSPTYNQNEVVSVYDFHN